MSDYLSNLLKQTTPLELHEISDLRAWLTTLQGDCEMFGETPEDTQRMDRIKRRIEEAERK